MRCCINTAIFTFKSSQNFIISLKEREDRRNGLITNLTDKSFDLSWFKIFWGIEDTSFGGIGCGKSHIYCLAQTFCYSTSDYVCVLEDDFNFRVDRNKAEELINEIRSKNPDFKVVLLGGHGLIPGRFTSASDDGFHIVTSVFESQSTCGYVCSRGFLPVLLRCFLEATSELERNWNTELRQYIYQRFAIDQYWKLLQRRGGWYTTRPMIGFQTASYSDIGDFFADYTDSAA